MLKDLSDVPSARCFSDRIPVVFPLQRVSPTTRSVVGSGMRASVRIGDGRVCPASVTHLSRRNVPLISASSRRLSDSSRAGVKWAAGGGAKVTGSHGFERPLGCLMECCGRRHLHHYHVPTLQEHQEQSSCKATDRSLPSCRAQEEQNISCYQVCPVGTEPAKHYGRVVGVRQWLNHVWRSCSHAEQVSQRLFFILFYSPAGIPAATRRRFLFFC